MKKCLYALIIVTTLLSTFATSASAQQVVAERELSRTENQTVGETVVAIPTGSGSEEM